MLIIKNMNKPDVGMVYFDVGDVLARHTGGLSALSDMFGVSLPELTNAWQALAKQGNRGIISTQAIWDNLKATFNYSGEDINFTEFWTSFLKPMYETHELLLEISRIVSIGLLTNLFPGMYELILKRGDIPDAPYLTSVVSCQVKVAKPDEGIFKIAESRVDVPPGRILLIDDFGDNITVANQRGWETVHFNPINPRGSINETRRKLGI
jgi:FMN phosphatase YigB (HAD superfamily)